VSVHLEERSMCSFCSSPETPAAFSSAQQTTRTLYKTQAPRNGPSGYFVEHRLTFVFAERARRPSAASGVWRRSSRLTVGSYFLCSDPTSGAADGAELTPDPSLWPPLCSNLLLILLCFCSFTSRVHGGHEESLSN